MSLVVAFATAGCTGKGANEGAQGNGPGAVGGGTPPTSVPGVTNTTNATGQGSSKSGTPATPGMPAAVNRILELAHSGDAHTYTATYRVRLSNGKIATTTLAQKPPKFGFHLVQGKNRNVVVSDGKMMRSCQSAGGSWTCAQTGIDDPTEVGNSYPGAVLHLIDGLVKGLGREIKAGTAKRTVQGVRVDCVTFTATIENAPPPQVFCVRKDGVIAYASTVDRQILELTGFKGSVSARDLTPPA